MIIEKYPSLKKAALAVAYDHGMINREHSQESFLERLDPVLASADDTDLETFGKWLAGLSDENFDTVCSGEDADAQAEALGCPRGGQDNMLLSEILNDIFDA